ncbi:MAG: hypothetical protein MK033_06125 [Candidatus Caenarcaniphilales bacterium]|nr:hypothetical protein [Candidatus Caenarcaniphilales bacterium]
MPSSGTLATTSGLTPNSVRDSAIDIQGLGVDAEIDASGYNYITVTDNVRMN